ncbi:hypothetical protein SVIOM74S_02785 [Streptomyces violarus]
MEEELPAQLEHVVRRAGLGVLVVQGGRDGAAGAEHLALPGAAQGVRAGARDHAPEVAGRGGVALLAGVVEQAEVAGELRDVLVGVSALQDVAVLRAGGQQRGVVEAAGGGEVFRPAGEGVQVRHDLVHAAVLTGDVDRPHALQLGLGEVAQPAVHPVAHLRGDGQRLSVAGQGVGVQEPAHDLVAGVVRRPDGGVRRVALQEDELGFRVGRQVAGVTRLRGAVFGEGLLAFAEGGDQVVELGLEGGLACVGVCLGDEGEEVAAVVAAQVAVGRFPAARRARAAGVESRVGAEDRQDAVGRVRAGVVEHQVALGAEDASAEADLVQGEGPHRPVGLGGQRSPGLRRGGRRGGVGGFGQGPGGQERGGRGTGGQAQHAAPGGWLGHGALRSSWIVSGWRGPLRGEGHPGASR